jgi:hypothetical protein
MQQEKVKIALEKFSKNVIKQARQNLTKKSHNDTKAGYDSLKYDLNVSKNSFGLEFFMLDYMEFQDKGVKGFKSTHSSASKSPFKFGKSAGKPRQSGGLYDSIEKWTKRKGIQGRDKKGRFITNKSLAYLIANSIYNKGLKGSMFFTRPFEQNYKKLPDELIEAFGLDLDNLLKLETNGNNIR